MIGLLVMRIIPANLEVPIDEHWDTFKQLYKKSYSPEEDSKRKLIFDENVRRISVHNLENDVRLNTYRLGINNYTDYTEEEFNELFNWLPDKSLEAECNSTDTTGSSSCDIPLPTSVDYRNLKMVTSVKDQGPCSNGYAYAAAGAMEALWKKKEGELHSLSIKELTECSKPEGNLGCKGGTVVNALKYILRNEGVDREIPYPFKNKVGPCSDVNKGYRASCSSMKVVPCGDEEALKRAVAYHGPVAVTIDAHLPEFHLYRSGIFKTAECKPNLASHSLLVVGYGTEDGVDYWLLKNSYGKSWGDYGYMMMARGNNNQCGIASNAVYPL